MPKVTIDGCTVEVEGGTNLVDAARQAGVQIPHYCYHPRLSVVGQCRMCLVKIDGIPKLQAACTTQVMKDGMEVHVDDEEVREAQEGVMEFLLINHPLDCPICDQAGECGLQDYSFEHGQSFSRFHYEEKRTYTGKERIPLGPNVLLNMNRCIQCTRCIRFTSEITETGDLGFFQRGARTEIGVFPGKEFDHELSTNVVDICPVGALTSSKFRFAERVWYLEKKPAICAGCDVGCNTSLEHRQGLIRRIKPRFNPEVNDYWMCDFGRMTHEQYSRESRLTTPMLRSGNTVRTPGTWSEALDTVHRRMTSTQNSKQKIGILTTGVLSTEEAYLVARLADAIDASECTLIAEEGPVRTIPRPNGPLSGSETTPNRRGAEIVGKKRFGSASTTDALLSSAKFAECSILLVFDSLLDGQGNREDVVSHLRDADLLIVSGWEDSALMRAADIALPTATCAESTGTYVNVEHRLQKFETAYPPAGQARPGVEWISELIARLDLTGEPAGSQSVRSVFARMAAETEVFAGMEFDLLSPEGIPLQIDSGQKTKEDNDG